MKIKILTSFFTLLLISTNSYSFRTVKHESFIDPFYTNYKAKRIVVQVNASSNEVKYEIEKRIVKNLSKYNVYVTTYRKLFPPTRQWTNDDFTAIITNNKIDSALIINSGSRQQRVIDFGTSTSSTSNVNGKVNYYGGFNATVNTRSTTSNRKYQKSTAEFNAILVDLSTGQTAWHIDLIVKAGGSLFVGNKGDAKGVSNKIANIIIEDKMINKK